MQMQRRFEVFHQHVLLEILGWTAAVSEKDGEPRNQVPEECFKIEEGWHEIFNVLIYCLII